MRTKVNLGVLVLTLTSISAIDSQLDQRFHNKRNNNKFIKNNTFPMSEPEKYHQSTTSIIVRAASPDVKLKSTQIARKFLDLELPFSVDDGSIENYEYQDKRLKKKIKKLKKKRGKWKYGVLALLMAYKLKFAALVPTMILGSLLLFSTTAMAGFFFALFAAILGLKGRHS